MFFFATLDFTGFATLDFTGFATLFNVILQNLRFTLANTASIK